MADDPIKTTPGAVVFPGPRVIDLPESVVLSGAPLGPVNFDLFIGAEPPEKRPAISPPPNRFRSLSGLFQIRFRDGGNAIFEALPRIQLPDLPTPLLDLGEILALVLSPDLALFSNTVRYTQLYDDFRRNGGGAPEQIRKGIHTWSELEIFVDQALAMHETAQNIEIELYQYQFPTLSPPPGLLQRIQEKLSHHPGKAVILAIHEDPVEPPVVYHCTGSTTTLSQIADDAPAIEFWFREDLQPILAKKFEEHPGLELLFRALIEWDSRDPEANLGEFLEGVVAQTLEPTKRTSIYSKLEKLRQIFFQSIKEVGIHGEAPAGVLSWNPVDTLLRRHPPNPEGSGWLSIGAGQMITTLHWPRIPMNLGNLSIDFRLIAVAETPALLWELVHHGTNQMMLGAKRVNPEDTRPIHILNKRQMLEAIGRYNPHVISLNEKASLLSKAMTPEFVEAIRHLAPVLTISAKAYDANGRIAYLDLYRKLKDVDPVLANRLVMIGGYFAAPWILDGRHIDLTLAGGLEEALVELAHIMSPVTVDKNYRANHGNLNIKIIPSVEVAALLMAGGANKNFLTYRSAHLLMDRILASPVSEEEVRAFLDMDQPGNMKRKNMEIGEEITARIVPFYGINTDHLWTPQGLEEDYIHCLPLPEHVPDFFKIKERVQRIIATGDLNFLNELIEEIRKGQDADGLGGGTRNARDGYMDAVLKHVHQALDAEGHEPGPFPAFYRAHYPKAWTGSKAQEGRNGIGPLISFAQSNGITLPKEVYESWNLYHPEAFMASPSEKQQRGLLEGEEDPAWGLSHAWVQRLEKTLLDLQKLSKLVNSGDKERGEIVSKLVGLLRHLGSREVKKGAFPEVNRRISSIHTRVNALKKLLTRNHFTDGEREKALKEFETQITGIGTLFSDKKPENVTTLLNHLLKIAQKIYRVELALQKDLKERMGLGTLSSNDMAQGRMRTPRPLRIDTKPLIAQASPRGDEPVAILDVSGRSARLLIEGTSALVAQPLILPVLGQETYFLRMVKKEAHPTDRRAQTQALYAKRNSFQPFNRFQGFKNLHNRLPRMLLK